MFLAQYSNLLKKVNRALKEFMDTNAQVIDNNKFLKFYYSEISKFLFSGGKRIRPILMIFSGAAINPAIIDEPIIKASLSLELLHNASLIHDDIMDYAETRRGLRAFHKTLADYSENTYQDTIQDHGDFGVAMGILGGDFVYNLAYNAIHVQEFPAAVTLRVSLEFNEGFFGIVRGVIIETDYMGRFDISEEEYIEMINGKTATLFEKAARMGSIYAGAKDTQIQSLGEFGKNAGIAFQIVDDIIGSFGDSKKTGKPTDSDIKEGKKTLLLIKAIDLADDNQKKLLSQIVGNRSATDSEVDEIREIFVKTGALEYAKNKAQELLEECETILDQVEPAIDEKYKSYLIEIAKMGINREK